MRSSATQNSKTRAEMSRFLRVEMIIMMTRTRAPVSLFGSTGILHRLAMLGVCCVAAVA